jgi:DNA replication protein DnaC
MSNLTYERVHYNLKRLNLGTVEVILDNYLELAMKEQQPVLEILDHLLEQECQAKDARALAIRLRLAGFPVQKSLESFDFTFQPSLDASVVRDLATLKFVHNAENVVFLGPPGVGKTHLAIGLGMSAVKEGFRVYFTNAASLIERLTRANRERTLEDKLKGISRYNLLIIDEIGYLPFTTEGAHCFFQLISRRYEHASTIFTSNKSYGNWGEIFSDHVLAAAILDRILHHCTTVNVKGDSYRLKERRSQGLIPRSLQ